MSSKNALIRILYVEQNQDGTVGGSYFSLLYLIRALDRKKYIPLIMFYENNRIMKRFADENCETIVYEKPMGKIFTPPFPFLIIPAKIAQRVYNFVNVSLIPLFHFIHFLHRHDIDLIHLNNSASVGWEWLLASKLLGKKCITHERGFMKFSRMAIKRGQHFDKIICISDAVRNFLYLKGLKENTITIHNGIDFREFVAKIGKSAGSVRDKLGIHGSTPLVGMVGNFKEWKGQRIVVESIAILKEKHADIVCLLVGDVATTNTEDMRYFQQIKEEIYRRRLEKNVIITGYREDVPDLMNACDILIHSSIEPEPFGRVVIEAMLLKKPVIATKHGGPLEIIKDGVSGYLISPGDPNGLAEKIDFLLQYPEIGKKLGEGAFCRIAKHFSMKRFTERINMLYGDFFH